MPWRGAGKAGSECWLSTGFTIMVSEGVGERLGSAQKYFNPKIFKLEVHFVPRNDDVKKRLHSGLFGVDSQQNKINRGSARWWPSQ